MQQMNTHDLCSILCEDKIFEANRCLLSQNNLYFRAMFSSSMKESVINSTIVLNGISADALEYILQFLQTNKIPQIQTDYVILLNLLSASHMFLIDELVEQCCRQLNNLIMEDNFIELWNLAKFYDNDILMEIIINFAAINFLNLKNVLMTNLVFKEMKQLLRHPYLKSISSLDLLNFLFDWVRQNLNNCALNLIKDLILCVHMNKLKKNDFEHFISHEPLLKSLEELTEAAKQSFCLKQLKFFVFSDETLLIYSLYENSWSAGEKLSFLKNDVIQKCFILEKIYFLSYSRSSVLSPDCLYCFNKDGSCKEMCFTINCRSSNHLTINNENLYVLRGNYNKRLHCWKNTLHIYDLNSKNFQKVMKFNSYLPVKYIIGFKSNIIIFEENSQEEIKLWERYDMSDQQWHKISFPNSYLSGDEFASICLDRLFLIVWERDSKSINWYENQPKPFEEIEALEKFGPVKISKHFNRFHCKALFRMKLFYDYDIKSDTWHETLSVDGPQEAHFVWEGLSSSTASIPYIYVIGDDSNLYQYDPKENEWNKLCSVPNQDNYELRLKSFTLGLLTDEDIEDSQKTLGKKSDLCSC